MMKKRLTSFLLAACMMLPLSASAWAAEHPQMEGEEDVTNLWRNAIESGLYIAYDIAVCEHNPFGTTGCSRCVDDTSQIIFLGACRQVGYMFAC